MTTNGRSVGQPVALVLPVIDECDGRCQMCGTWRRRARPPLVPIVLGKILSDRCLSTGLTHVNVTGGDPVSHPDLGGIATMLSEYCTALREVNLNVSGLDPDRTAEALPAFRGRLAPAISLMFTFSLDGVGKLHDAIRGVTGAFERTVSSIERCQRLVAGGLDARFQLNATLCRPNLDAVPDLITFAERIGLGLTLTYAAANGLFLSNLDQRNRFDVPVEGREPAEAVFAGLAENHRFAATERHYYAMVRRMLSGEPRPCGCVYQTRGVFLDLDGMVYPCGTAPDLPYGQLPDESFEAIYFGERGDAVRRAILQRYCPSCPTNSYHGLADGVWLEVLRERRSRP